MPNTQSATKALRQSGRRRTINRHHRDAMRMHEKKFRASVAARNNGDMRALLPRVYQVIDKAAKRGVIKWQAADRKKSRLARLLRTLQSTAA
ncbi:MAG: 30S ribosomal protein S20 [Parcubacteria group bacterium]|nr:30S ribosomal protein S20 [Parcubacteria group bacterium]